jgi:hypothetical protein
MAQENSISQELADLLVTNNFDPEYRDEGGKSSGPGDANTVSFDYRSTSGNNYGSAVAVIGDDNELMLFFGDNLGRSMQDQDKDEWFGFLNQMRKLAQTHRYTFSPQNLSRLKHSLAGQAAVKEGLFEGYYGSRRESFIGEPTEARILIKHNKIIGEDDKRYRYIESIFIETADGERFKLQSNRLIHGRAMLEHVRSGGRPYDVRGNHINEMVQELSVLSRFNRAKQHHVYEGITQELVESAAHYYRSLQENLKRLSSSRGYHTYFESWAPDQIDQQESLVEDLKNMFVQQTLDTRIEAALPTLAKIQQQGTKMKEAEIFENYMNRLSEGTWALPDTPEAYEKLQQLMTGELIVGADAMNATEQLYDLVGDDELFDILNDLADNDPRANIWDDSDVQRRLAELGVQTPQSTQAAPAAVPQDTAPPAVPAVAEGELDEQVMGGQMNMFKTFSNNVANGQDAKQAALAVAKDYGMKPEQVMFDLASFGKQSPQWIDTPELQNAVKTLQQLAAANRAFDPQIEESNELAEGDDFGPGPGYPLNNQAGPIYAGPERIPNTGVPDKKNYKAPLSDKYGPVGHAGGWDAAGQQKYIDRTAPGVINKIKDKLGLDMPDPNHGPRPDERERLVKRYPAPANENAELARMLQHAGVPLQEGVLTDSTGSTLEHIKDTFKRDIKDFSQSGEMSEHLFRRLYDYYFDDMPYGAKTGDDIDPYQWVSDRFANDLGINENLISPVIMPVSEGSCNMTMEGEYCPEHGLMECGGMYEDGGAVGMPYSMGEGVDDPINYNAAMTGSYYEGKETDVQEGDALLARIKSLALLR